MPCFIRLSFGFEGGIYDRSLFLGVPQSLLAVWSVHIEAIAEDRRVLHKGMKGIFNVWPCRLSSRSVVPGGPIIRI